jgi:hypothetical protein
MAPLPAYLAASTPSYSPLSTTTMWGEYTLSREIFEQPAQSAAVPAAELEAVEGISLQIATAIWEGRWVTNGWTIAHLVRHWKLVTGLTADDAFTCFDHDLPGFVQSWLDRSEYSDYVMSVRALGRAINKAMDQRGFTVMMLLQQLITHTVQRLMGPPPVPPGEETPLTSSATPSVLACSPTTPTCRSQGSLSAPTPPTTTGGGAPAAKHRAATTILWSGIISAAWATVQWQRRVQELCRGASAYAVSVWGKHHPPPILTNKSSDPKVLRHPFRDRGQPLPQWRRAQRTNSPCRRPG